MWNFNSLRIGHIVFKDDKMDIVSIVDFPDIANKRVSRSVYKPIKLNDELIQAYGFKKSYNKQYKTILYKRGRITLKKNEAFDYYYCSNMPLNVKIHYLHELQDFYNINTSLSLDFIDEANEFVATNRFKLFSYPDYLKPILENGELFRTDSNPSPI